MLKNYNYHNIFLSLYVYNQCKKKTSWINVYDNHPKIIEFNFTNEFYYFASLDYSLNEYKSNDLTFELKNYDKKLRNIVIVSTNKEKKFIENNFKKLNKNYLIEIIK